MTTDAIADLIEECEFRAGHGGIIGDKGGKGDKGDKGIFLIKTFTTFKTFVPFVPFFYKRSPASLYSPCWKNTVTRGLAHL
jgi:hypothetical protein